jgi:hypothetical protein
VGIGLVAFGWRSLEPGRRVLAGGAIGWLALGMATLLVASYRPSRYVVPMLPAMAILVGFAVALGLERLRAVGRPAVIAVVAAALCIGAAFAGVRDLVTWTAAATYRLPQIQAELHRTVNDGHAIEGAAAPTFAMRVRAATIVVRPGLNDGDLYGTHGVRWLLDDPQARPAWSDDHPDAWDAREQLACYPWPSGETCLIRVP